MTRRVGIVAVLAPVFIEAALTASARDMPGAAHNVPLLTVQNVAPKRPPDASRRLNTIQDVFRALSACWTPPQDNAWPGMQITVLLSFKRSGEMIATPRVTFATSGVSADTRATYQKAINASLEACLPLKFTAGLGGALAGRPIAIRYVDNRALGKTSQQQ